MFWVISVYFNIRNTLPDSGTLFLGHSVYFKDFQIICLTETLLSDTACTDVRSEFVFCEGAIWTATGNGLVC